MTRTRKSKRQRSISRRLLRCERLEQRSLLAVASFHLDFFEDAGGVPGEPISDDTVEVGEAFFVEIRAREHDPRFAGLAGISLDIAWDAALLDIVEPFDPREAVTSNLPLMVRGSLHQDESSVLPFLFNNQVREDVGHIAGLGGSSFSAYGVGRPIGSDGSDQFVKEGMRGLSTTDDHFAWLHFRAEQPGEGLLTMRQGGSGIATMPVSSLSSAQLDFEVKTLTIVQPNVSATNPVTSTELQVASSPRIEIATGSEQIQFTTIVGSEDTLSPLVRPAFPDDSKFIEVSNTGDAPLTITDIHINAPDVTVSSGGNPIVVQPGQTKKLQLTYAPKTPNATDTTVQSFDLSDGIVIFSDADNSPVVHVGLRGDSTFDADTNYDGRVDLADLISFDQNFGAQSGDGSYRPRFDPNGDGVIDVADLRPFAAHYNLSRDVPLVGPVKIVAEGEGPAHHVPLNHVPLSCVPLLARPAVLPAHHVPLNLDPLSHASIAADERRTSQAMTKAPQHAPEELVRASSFIGPLAPGERATHSIPAAPATATQAVPNLLDDDLIDLLATDVTSRSSHPTM